MTKFTSICKLSHNFDFKNVYHRCYYRYCRHLREKKLFHYYYYRDYYNYGYCCNLLILSLLSLLLLLLQFITAIDNTATITIYHCNYYYQCY